MFEVAYETTFCATHRLTEEGRPLEPLHGHDWRVEAVAAGPGLDRIGVVVDFEHLKKVVGQVAARFAPPTAPEDASVTSALERALG